MKIKILGTRGNIEASSRNHSKHSGVLIDKTLLFDLGEREFLKYNPKSIFITHLHPDHAFFVKEKAEIKIPIYAPEKFKGKTQVKVLSGKMKLGPYQITPIPTIHSRHAKSAAYLIQKGKEKILYSGDIIWLKKEYWKQLKSLDLVITEGSFLRKGGLVRREKETGKIFGHTGIPDLIKLFGKFTENMALMHFGSWFFKDIKKSKKKLEKLGNKHNVKLMAARDGLELSV